MADKKNIKAFWSVNLYCNCENCHHQVDLLEDFSKEDAVSILSDIGSNADNISVICPECNKNIIVDIQTNNEKEIQ